ncbi:YlmC/YmxH family sporulation protein [Clostridium sporogenes]|uniref:YlmC/YmxH family sporulation protein n=1 Tax=Clostridium TaxID=1485 RepID=UPI0022373824|nr:YlmC/YmxH family sporulation protein [Clostridium sporogenes]MCW6074500.1 YlmC/YmxH family sporulation protein [Clostridium sporogenes]
MEQVELYSIESLKNMEVIDLNTGSKMGYIKDLIIDCDSYKILSIVLPTEKVGFFNKKEDLEIGWDKIYKIGTDVILVNGDSYLVEDN